MQRHVVKRWLVCLALLSLSAASFAAVSVTQVTVAGTGAPYDVSYVLNTLATSGSVELLNASNQVVRTLPLSGGALSRGIHVVQWDGKDSSNQPVSGGQYKARITVSGGAVPAGGAVLWGPVQADPASATPGEYGLCVNRNPGSPYYGRIFATSYANDTLFAIRADGERLYGISYQNFSDPNDPLQPLGAGTRGPYVGPDDRLYVGTQLDSGVASAQSPHYLSMTQTGTDVSVVFDSINQQRALFVTGTGASRRFYYTQAVTRATSPTAGGSVQVRTEDGSDTTIIDATTDPAGFAGNPDGIVVVDSNTDPAGHSNNTTIYVRLLKVGSAGESNVAKYDNNSSNPAQTPYVRDATFNASASLPATSGYNGRGLALAPDGNLWACVAGLGGTTRGFVKLDKSTGAKLDSITVPTGQGNPWFVGCDNAGNVIGYETPEGSTSVRAGLVSMFAPQSSGNTDAATSPAFTVSGTVLTPIHITAGPTLSVNATSATVTWTTDVASSSEVAYGLSASALSSTATGADAVTTHSVTLSGLTKLTPYFFQVRSAAAGFASVQSDVASFTTKDTVTLSNVQATAGQTTATVTWTTDKPTASTVRYGLTPDALDQTASVPALGTSHSVNLTGLAMGTTYYFVAVSGSDTVEDTASAESSFATLNAAGFRVITQRAFGDFKYGLLDDIHLLDTGFTLNKQALPSAIVSNAIPVLPDRRENPGVAAYGGYLYVAGGRGAQNVATVFYAPIRPDGTVGAWSTTSLLPDERSFLPRACVGYNGYLYVVGGEVAVTGNAGVPQLTTLYAKQNPLDGSLGPWAVAGTFPDPASDGSGGRGWGAAAISNGVLYYVGGEDPAVVTRQETLFAPIKPDGTLGTWTTATELLPAGTKLEGLAAHAGRLYVWGGTADNSGPQNQKLVSVLGVDAQPAAWQDNPDALFSGRFAFAGGITHGNALIIGGDNGAVVNTVSAAPVNANFTLGDVGDLSLTYETPTGSPLRDMDGAVWQDRFYVIGGRPTQGAADIDANAVNYTAAISFENSANFVFAGRFESPIIDLRGAEPLQSLVVSASSATGVTLTTRTAGADGVFSAWAAQPGLNVTFPAGTTARYFQYALALTSPGATAPTINSVALTYGTASSPLSRADVETAIKIAAGIQAAQSADLARLDLVKADGSAGKDGLITLADAVKASRMAQ